MDRTAGIQPPPPSSSTDTSSVASSPERGRSSASAVSASAEQVSQKILQKNRLNYQQLLRPSSWSTKLSRRLHPNANSSAVAASGTTASSRCVPYRGIHSAGAPQRGRCESLNPLPRSLPPSRQEALRKHIRSNTGSTFQTGSMTFNQRSLRKPFTSQSLRRPRTTRQRG